MFFTLQNGKLTILQLYYNFLAKTSDSHKYEEMEMDTDSQYLALAEKEVNDSLRSEKRQVWELLRSKDFHDLFTADACSIFLSECVVLNTTNIIDFGLHPPRFESRQQGLFCLPPLFTLSYWTPIQMKYFLIHKTHTLKHWSKPYLKTFGHIETLDSLNLGYLVSECRKSLSWGQPYLITLS